jgi:allophanate hydrolase
MDVLVVPSAPTIYTHQEIAADPVRLNTNLGFYTNFVNLLDQAAVATPGGFRADGLPFGITFIGPAFSDEALLALADRYHRSHADVAGHPVDLGFCPPGCIAVAVVGAHLSGQPLNWQLTERRARLLKTTKTPPGYRLYALPNTQPPKPGLVREEEFQGPGIEVEVWAMPENEFGSFVAAVPAPLGIGSATLESGDTVKCFICEPYAVSGATEITQFGGWRAFLASQSLTASV